MRVGKTAKFAARRGGGRIPQVGLLLGVASFSALLPASLAAGSTPAYRGLPGHAAQGAGQSARTGAALAQSSDAPVVHHILGTGQSLATGFRSTPALTLTQPYGNRMLGFEWQGSSRVYTSLVPLVEGGYPNGGETIASSLANTLSARNPGYRSLVSSHAVDGATYARLARGTEPYADGLSQVAAAHSLLNAQGIRDVVDAVTVIHGEDDGVPWGTATPYKSYLEQWQRDYSADVRAINGQGKDVVLFTDQVSSYRSTSAIPQAQWLASRANPGRIVLVGPKYFLPYHEGDDHLTNVGERMLGRYYARAYQRTIIGGTPWRPFEPTGATICKGVVTARFNVPRGPMQIDTNNVPVRANYGFEFYDNSGNTPRISKVAITGANTIQVSLARVPTGTSMQLRYAFRSPDPTATSGQAMLPRGNLRDSDRDIATARGLPNWLIHFVISVKRSC